MKNGSSYISALADMIRDGLDINVLNLEYEI